MGVEQIIIEALREDINAINGAWLAICETRFTLIEDGLFDQDEPFFTSDVDLLEPEDIDFLASYGQGRIGHIARGIDDITRLVVGAYSRTDEWAGNITPSLKQRSTWARRRATQDFLAGTGRGLPDGYKLGGWAFADKEQRVLEAVGEMRGSFNNRLPGWVNDVKAQWIQEQGSLKGLNRNSMAARLRGKIEQWHGQYNDIAAATEIGTQYDQQLRELVARNDVDLLVRIMPEDADPGCRWGCPDLAGQEMLFSASPAFPLHPNCKHYRQVVPGSFSLPLDASVDLGGPTRYFPRNLPEL
jgi:hypothetical protein